MLECSFFQYAYLLVPIRYYYQCYFTVDTSHSWAWYSKTNCAYVLKPRLMQPWFVWDYMQRLSLLWGWDIYFFSHFPQTVYLIIKYMYVPAVIWLRYCQRGVKQQSINHFPQSRTVEKKQKLFPYLNLLKVWKNLKSSNFNF